MSLHEYNDRAIFNEYNARYLERKDPNTIFVNRLVEKINLGKEYKEDLREYLEEVSGKMVLL